MTNSRQPIIASALVHLAAAAASAGPDWTEVGDAGKLNAQLVSIPVQPTSITGTLGGAPLSERGDRMGDADGGNDIADLYDIQIDEVDEFIATTYNATFELTLEVLNDDGSVRTGSNFDTALWLFRADRRGVMANNDISPTNTASRLLPVTTDGTGSRLTAPGRYLLAVSFGDVRPVSMGGLDIFSFANAPGSTQVSGPDGQGGSGTLTQWLPDTTHALRKYRISIRPAPCPEPCPGDANLDHVVNFADVSTVLSVWGNTCP